MKRHFQEILAYLVIVIVSYLLLQPRDLFEVLHSFSRAHEQYEIDEIFLLLPISLLCLALFSILRLRDLKKKSNELELVHEDLERAKLHLEELVRAREAFMAVACHELKSPLYGIVDALRLMELSQNENEKRESAELAMGAAKTLGVLIDDVREFNRLNIDRPVTQQEFNVPGLLKSIRSVAQAEADAKGLDLSISVDPKVPENILGSEASLRLIVLNLIGNAVKFTNQGTVKVRFDSREDPRRELVVTIQDTGHGIPAEDLERIFEAYNKVDKTSGMRGGLGLGLSIVKRLVEQLDGEITVASEVGRGSLFTVVIPLKTV